MTMDSTGFEVVVAAAWLPDPLAAPRWRDGSRNACHILRSLVASHDGAWVAPAGMGEWPGMRAGVRVEPVSTEDETLDDFLFGQCEGTLGPLYLDAGTAPEFRREWRQAYRSVNRRVAATVARCAAPDAAVWVHDLHLQLVPGYLRELRPDLRIGLFFDGRFPDPERFLSEPLRDEIIGSLLDADVLGFQQRRSALHFSAVADLCRPYGPVPAIGVYSRGVDVPGIEALARHPAVLRASGGVRAGLGNPGAVLLSVGHAAQNQGSYRLLEAYTELLSEGTIDPAETTLMHVSICGDDPTHLRCDRARLDRRIAQINGVFGTIGRPAVHYVHRELAPGDMVALYLSADVLLALPLQDGTTVPAKEYVTARAGATGRVVLSEFSGSTSDLAEADIVNPHDIDAVKGAIERAVRHAASHADIPDAGMARMRHRVVRSDATAWAQGFLATIRAARPRSGVSHTIDAEVGGLFR